MSTTETRAHLPLGYARCIPSQPCPQRQQCARANDWPWDEVEEVDASLCLRNGWCPMFIDRRGVRLLEAA
jgi:hypothetical protein